MGRHHEPGPGRDGRPERRELVGLEVVGAPRHDTERVVRVLGQRAQTREVLRRGGHPGRLEAADHRRPMTADRSRIVAERADAERRVVRLGGEIDGRGIDDVDAQRAGLAPDRRPDPLGQRFVVDRAERHVAGELGRLGTEGVELAALLVGGDEEAAAAHAAPPRRPLQRRGQLPHLPRPLHVERHVQRHPGGRRLGQPALDPGRDPLALEGDHHPFEDPLARHPLTAPARPRTK